MSDDLVNRLKDAHANATQRILGSSIFGDAATALTEARAEIEARDAFIKELSDALRSIRPLGGSELFVKRFGNYYADPVYCKAAIEQDAEHKHNAMKAYVKERKRADAAESELSTLRARVREVVGPFSRLDISHTDDIDDSALVFENEGGNIVLGHLRAARQLNEDLK